MVLLQKLTPETAIGSPRRSAAVPAPSSLIAFFTVSTHTFMDGGNAKGKTNNKLMLLNLYSGDSWPMSTAVPGDDVSDGRTSSVDNIHDICWIPVPEEPEAEIRRGPEELLWLRAAASDPGITEIVVAAAITPSSMCPNPAVPAPYVAATIPAPVSALRLRALSDGSVALAVAGLVAGDGTLYNSNAKAANLGTTARIYDTWQVREWDRYLEPQRYSIWYGSLVRRERGMRTAADTPSLLLDLGPDAQMDRDTGANARPVWSLAAPLHNALHHASGIEAPAGIYEPGPAANSFDIGPRGIVFVGRDPSATNPLTIGCSQTYYVPLDSYTAPPLLAPSRIARVPSSSATSSSTAMGTAGYGQNPRFSPDGSMIAFLWSPLECPVDIRLHVGKVSSGAAVDVSGFVSEARRDGAFSNDASDINQGSRKAWPIVPSAFEFAPSGLSVILSAPDCGREKLFSLDLQPGAAPKPLELGHPGSVSSFYIMPFEYARGSPDHSYAILASGSSFMESSFYVVLNVQAAYDVAYHITGQTCDCTDFYLDSRVVTTSKSATRFSLSHAEQVSEMYFEGGGDGYCVHSWILRPRNFDPNKRYPVALLLHGGPESAWSDEWQPRWNAAVWAEEGYVVVLPNITGSTGFGLEHTKRMYGSWGGYPYEDLVRCMSALQQLSYVDLDRAIIGGASYGGYLTNWVLSSPLAKLFRAAVTQDSVFSTEHMNLNSDAPLGVATFRGSGFPWDNYDELMRWNPARSDRLRNLRTHAPPTLVIHSDLDFRCPVTDGLSIFRALQFQGVPSRFLEFPDENHQVRKADNLLAWNRVVFGWLRQWNTEDVNEDRKADQQRRLLGV